MGRLIDISGRRFGRLVVLHQEHEKHQSGNALWACQCDCGNLIVTESYRLRHGIVKSCGCLRRESSAQRIRENVKTRIKMGNKDSFKDSLGNPVQMVKIGSRNANGVIGVSYDQASKKWVARMMFKGKLVLNSTFKNFEDAVQARRLAELKYLNHK